jgi:ABC-type multidrug transport system fused ATPase/permease subunit
LSQKGNDLSGGQWQKIALLRALYRNNTNIMILDEPTAALDPLAEAELYRNFSQITGDRTTLLISHRLGITKLVDRILVFCDGRIIEDGTHQELMKKKGHYYEMYQAQAAWYQT